MQVVDDGGHTSERECLNCGCRLQGEYCHCCGQKAHVHRTVGAWWHDLVHGVLHLDGKVWRTLPLLAIRPGELTRRYIAGERASFVSPLALFLASVFLMFAVFSALGGPFTTSSAFDDAAAEAERETAQLREAIQRLERERAALGGAGRSTAAVEERIAELDSEIRAVEGTRRIILAPSSSRQASSEIDVRDMRIDTGWPRLDNAITKARENPSLLFYKVQTNAYKFSWALIPISLPFLWLLFLHRERYRRDFGAYDHLVFITYSIAFMSLGLVVLALLRPIGLGAIAGLAIALVPPVHLYLQLRGAYGLSPRSAAWRTAALLVFALVALTLFLLLLLTLGVLG